MKIKLVTVLLVPGEHKPVVGTRAAARPPRYGSSGKLFRGWSRARGLS